MFCFQLEPEDLEDKLIVPFYRTRQVVHGLEHHFDTKRLDELGRVASGTYVDTYVSDGLVYLRVNNIREYRLNLTDADTVRVPVDHPAITDRAIVRTHNVVLPRTGAIGRAAIVTDAMAGAVMSQHVSKIVFHNMNPYYGVAFLNSRYGKHQMVFSSYGSTRPELTHGALERIRIPLVALDIQEEVERCLVEADRAHFEALAGIKQALGLLRTAMGIRPEDIAEPWTYSVDIEDISDTFIPKHYYPRYTETLKRMRERFRTISLGRIAHLERGKGTRVADYRDEGIPFIRTKDLIDYEIDSYPDFYASEDTYQAFNQPVQADDILFAIEGKVGQSAILLEGERCVYKNHIQRVRVVGETIDPVFVFLFLNIEYGLNQVQAKTVIQTTLPGMAGRLAEVEIPIEPSTEEVKEEFERIKAAAVEAARKALRLKRKKKDLIRSARELVESALEAKT